MIDGIARPNLLGISGKVGNQFVVGKFWIFRNVIPPLRRQLGTDDDFVADISSGPVERELLVAEERGDGDDQKQKRGPAPAQRVLLPAPATRGEKHQPQHHRDDELAKPQPDFFVAGGNADGRRHEKSAEDAADPESALREREPVFSGRLQPGFGAGRGVHFTSAFSVHKL